MSNPVQSSGWCPPLDVQAALRDVTGARPDARANGSVPDAPHPLLDVADTAARVAGDITLTPEQGPISLLTAGNDIMHGIGKLLDDAHQEGDRRNLVYHQHRMEGALAVLEGRADNPEVKDRMQRDPAYRDGYMRAEQLFRTNNAEFLSLATAVRACGHAGMLSVVDGTDQGARFEQRYAEDPAFAHGVDYMRRLRTDDPSQFDARASALTSHRDDIRAAQCSFLRS